MPAIARTRLFVTLVIGLASIALAVPATATPAPGVSARIAPSAETVDAAALLEHQIATLRGNRAILRFDPGATSRARVVDRLNALGLQGAAFRALPMVAVRGPLETIREAARVEGIVAVHEDEKIEFDLNESVPLIYEGQQRAYWSRGFSGSGVNVAVVDSGVDATHPDLKARVRRNLKFLDFGQGQIGLPTYIECRTCNLDTTSGHGTHVAGTAVGDGTRSKGTYTGVAPGAGLIGLGVGDGDRMFFVLSAFDFLLTHPRLNVVAVNNSWGRSQADGRGRFDYSNPVNVASARLYTAGIQPVFSAGNTGTGARTDEPGASDCDTVPADPSQPNGPRMAGPGVCRFTVYGSAPWAIAVAAGRKDEPGGQSQQHLASFSSRGDTREQLSLDGKPVYYTPLVTAPGVNIRAARNPLGVVAQASSCVSAEPPSCVPPKPLGEPWYMPLSGTSMAAPHVTGAIAAIQSAAIRIHGRRLSNDEVRSALKDTATPMTQTDGFYDWPCGTDLILVYYPACGSPDWNDPPNYVYSGTTYERYQVGFGYLNLRGALDYTAGPRFAPAPAPTTTAVDGGTETSQAA